MKNRHDYSTGRIAAPFVRMLTSVVNSPISRALFNIPT